MKAFDNLSKKSVLFFSLLLALCPLLISSCHNPWMAAILGDKEKPETPSVPSWNDIDFGPNAVISFTFGVLNLTEWDEAVNAITGGGNDKNYIINVIGDFDVPGTNDATFGSATGIKVSLRGNKTIVLSSVGNLIRIDSNQTVILRGLTLQGFVPNESNSVVFVSGDNSVFTMHSGKIFKNSADAPNNNPGQSAYGVSVTSSGTFTMNDGAITANGTIGDGKLNGGGVYISSSGTFTMNKGTISGNSAYSGGGVSLNNGTFVMNGGTISGNEAISGPGGGVYMSLNLSSPGPSCFFTMNGGKISDNTGGTGGGVSVSTTTGGPGTGPGRATFTMNSGTISGNIAKSIGGGNGGFGGGVSVTGSGNYDGIFIMNGGTISGNTAITGNTAGRGGGVYVSTDATFRIVTGTIYGSNASPASLRNTATDGAALYKNTNGTAQRGTFAANGTTWSSKGTLSTTNNTIRVVEGVLQ
jgi:hypothetical protein